MSETTFGLAKKLDSARDLRSVVHTMKAMAAASIQQYEHAVAALADYYRSVELGLGACLRDHAIQTIGTTTNKPGLTVNVIVFGSDQGLVGNFNQTIADFVSHSLQGLPGKFRYWAVGERVGGQLIELGLPVQGVFLVPGSIKGISPLIGQILLEIESQARAQMPATLYLFYNRPVSAASYDPQVHRLLPLDQAWLFDLNSHPWPAGRHCQVLSHGSETLGAFIREYLFVSLFRGCAESLSSEHASRLGAMQRAERNIDELLQDLSLRFHSLRKAAIDEELLDLISAYEPPPS
jgi:F-type H+-transporting ATPase subunit gamma